MSNSDQPVARTRHLFGVFKDHETDWVFNRTLQHMYVGAAQIGECLYAAKRIDEKDLESWIREWTNVAQMVEGHGDESMRGGHAVSARGSYLRASNYYRTAEYGTPPSHPRFHELWRKSVECFRRASKLFDPPVQVVEVPFEGYSLPGYFWHADSSREASPTLILVGGNDGTLEENFFSVGPEAHDRGYNFFTFDHPGHRGAVHLYPNCVKRPDPEVPYEAAVDFVEALPGVDDRLAMAGMSFGGYITARTISNDNRIKAAVLDSPVTDVHELGFSSWKGILTKIPKAILKKLIEKKMNASPITRALKEYSAWSAGIEFTTDIQSMSDHYKSWFVSKERLSEITCPVLSLVSMGDGEVLIKQANEFHESVSSESKRLHVFSLEKDGSDDHVQLDNRMRGNQVMFDWLDEVFIR